MRIQGPPCLYPLSPTKSVETERLLQGLRLGEVLRAVVLQRHGDGRALVQVADRVLMARCPSSIEVGVPFRVSVESLLPEVVLRILARAAGPQTLLRRCLLRAIPRLQGDEVKGLWKGALGEWQALDARGPSFQGKVLDAVFRHCLRPGSWNLQAYLEGSGLLLEPKLAGRLRDYDSQKGPWPDFKALLLRVIQGLGERGLSAQATRGLLDVLQGGQSLILLAKEGENHLFLPLILWGFLKGDWGDLRVHRDGGTGGRPNRWTLTLRLDLAALGRILVQMMLEGRILNCRFQVSDLATERMIQERLPAFREKLSAMGLQGVQCRCGPLEEKESWERPLQDIPEGLLQMRV